MSNVIRPTFGKLEPASTKAPPPASVAADGSVPIRIYGKVAGYVVALVRDEAAPQGPALKIAVGTLASTEITTVAILPATVEGEADADVVAMAILRTLEIVEAAPAGSQMDET